MNILKASYTTSRSSTLNRYSSRCFSKTGKSNTGNTYRAQSKEILYDVMVAVMAET